MLVGETVSISRVVTQPDGSAFTATSPAATVTAPDGTTSTPTVTANPGDTENASQTLSMLLTPVQGGIYRIQWSYADASSGQTIYLQDSRFASWTNAYTLACNRLQRELPAALMEPEFASAARILLKRFPSIGNGVGSTAAIGNYNLLTDENDQSFFDEAMTLAVCARIVGPLNSEGGASDVIERKGGDEDQRMAGSGSSRAANLLSPGDAGAGPGGYGGANERERWLREAAACIGRIQSVQQELQSFSSGFSMFTVDGPTRRAKAGGEIQTLETAIIRLFTDDFSPATDFFGGWGLA